jgi:hypothetical protein
MRRQLGPFGAVAGYVDILKIVYISIIYFITSN